LIQKLKALESSGKRIRVGVIGCGAMGTGVALQVSRAPGMEVVFVSDLLDEALARGVKATGKKGIEVTDAAKLSPKSDDEVYVVRDTLAFLEADNGVRIDAIVECTNTIALAGRFCLAAIARKAHVILMNAEVDLALGRLLVHEAKKQNVIVTSDAGDQHGVLATMIDEIELWGFRIVQAGNMKGFLNRYGDAAGARPWAEKQRLSVVQTVSYTDGTKMNIEQALIGNYAGLTPVFPGMEGPKVTDVREVLEAFDFGKYGEQGRVDYTVGVPWPGGGVYVVGYCDDELQKFYLNYYKVSSKGNYHLFFRPYHLCHLETPRAIAQAWFDQRAVIEPARHWLNDVFAHAKKDLPAGTRIEHGIGGDEFYGLVDSISHAGAEGVPVCALESEGHGAGALMAVLTKAYRKDEAIRLSDLEMPDTDLSRMRKIQAALA
jgi:predicted homoserine dehydrogenase-like protein